MRRPRDHREMHRDQSHSEAKVADSNLRPEATLADMLQFDQKQVIGLYLHVVDAEHRTLAPRLDLAPTSTA